MILGFKTKTKVGPTLFPEKILDGVKIHTIRIGDRWRPGMKIQFATGVRTKKYAQFKSGICVSVQKIKITCNTDYVNDQKVYVDDRLLSTAEVQSLAYNDGFNRLIDFCLWFNEDFEGQLIHWTDKKY